jgi:hypothetical protein
MDTHWLCVKQSVGFVKLLALSRGDRDLEHSRERQAVKSSPRRLCLEVSPLSAHWYVQDYTCVVLTLNASVKTAYVPRVPDRFLAACQNGPSRTMPNSSYTAQI